MSGVPPNGASVGRYRLVAPLGQGGMADVHLARMRGPAGFDKLVVIKQILPHLADDPDVLRMFLDEARLAARLAHPNVVSTYEIGREGKNYFIAMEFLDGQPLSRVRGRLHGLGGLPLAMHLRILVDVLAGLHHAHELTDYDGSPLGVVHRDVTPGNVFITYAGSVKIVDFGIAKAECSRSHTSAGTFKGKISYMSREQALGEPVDRRADVFAVGVMLWEAVACQRLWAGVEPDAIRERLVARRLPPLRFASPGVPAELEAIVHRALAPARGDRYATAADFQDALEGYLERSGDHTHPRELGRLVGDHFASERAAVRALVEEQGRADAHARGSDAPPAEERITAPERAAPGSQGGSLSPRPSSFPAVERAAPAPHRRWRSARTALGLITFAALTVALVRALPPRHLRGGTGAAVPRLVTPPVVAAAAPAAIVEVVAISMPGAAPIFLDAGAPHAAPAPAWPAPRHPSLQVEPCRRRLDDRNPYGSQ